MTYQEKQEKLLNEIEEGFKSGGFWKFEIKNSANILHPPSASRTNGALWQS